MMRKEPPKESEGAVLTDAMMERLLRRASELDVVERSSSKLAQLRDAAVEAGISPTAFDAALAEMRVESAPVAVMDAKPVQRSRWIALAAAGVMAMAVVFVAVGRAVAPSRPRPLVGVEQVFQLNCLTPARAAQLIQPVLTGRNHALSWSDRKNSTSNILTVRAPAERMEVVRAIISKSDQVGSAACPVAPTR